jgi:exonuclease III
MKIVNWNCKNDYYKRTCFDENKENIIKNENMDTDLFIIEECTYADCIRLKKKYEFVTWFGDGKDSILGIGTFSQKHDLKLSPEFITDNKLRYIIPYYFYKNSIKVNIFLVWAKTTLYYQSNDDKKIYDEDCCFEYVENVYESMIFYKNILKGSVILIGDFNSGITQTNTNKNHDYLVEYLSQYKIKNCSLKFNQEKSPTFFQMDKHGKENFYTDDYCFVSNNIEVENFSIGKKEIYGKYSDHLPIILEINIK